MNYILLYLAVGLPVALGCGLAYSRADRVWKKCLFGLILLSVWPLIPVVMIREALALKRIQEVCAWCGETVVAFKNPNRIEIWKAHHKVCPKHPMREEIERLEKEIEQIRADHPCNFPGHNGQIHQRRRLRTGARDPGRDRNVQARRQYHRRARCRGFVP